MRVYNRSLFTGSIYVSLILIIVAMFLLIPTPASFAGDQNAVSVKVTIGPSIGIGPGGAVKSNVSALVFEDSALLTIVAR
ncbi:MAG: hypothetical protein C4536_08605 [Actinobacteria bacterium]|jgi:hypothetical protein|nr:MAG: hypothetical protein C4536_08605 [Actinomycetota bacterium]